MSEPTKKDRLAGVKALTADEAERLRTWLYEHNGAQGPNPITKGAGGLGGLMSLFADMLAARRGEQ